MIIVSLFEREMIALQNKSNIVGNIVIGRKAVEYTGDQMHDSKLAKNYNTRKLYAYNMQEYLNTLFSRTASNFAAVGIKDNIIRDYLMHGMYDNIVRREDCIKLFNAFCNWLYIKESFEL
jgi:hypothetical protein